MKKAYGINAGSMRELNVFSVQNCIYERGPISRFDIAAAINASAATVSRAVEVLIEKGLVKTVGTIDNPGVGRKAELLEFNYDYGLVVGLYIRERRVNVATADLKGRILYEEEISTRLLPDNDAYMKAITELIGSAVSQNRDRPLLIISVACFGLVNERTGEILQSISMPKRDGLLIKKALEDVFHVPVLLENDVNMAAVGEYSSCRQEKIDHMAYLEFGSGIGAGIILNGELYRGHASGAGELAFCLLDEWQLYQDRRGQGGLGDRIGFHKTEEEIAKVLLRREGQVPEHHDIARLRRLLELYEEDDLPARRLIDRMVNYMAMAVCNFSCILNPQRIVLGGDYVEAWGDFLLERIRYAVQMAYPLAPEICLPASPTLPELVGAIEFALTATMDRIPLEA